MIKKDCFVLPHFLLLPIKASLETLLRFNHAKYDLFIVPFSSGLKLLIRTVFFFLYLPYRQFIAIPNLKPLKKMKC